MYPSCPLSCSPLFKKRDETEQGKGTAYQKFFVQVVSKFTQMASSELLDERTNVNFLVADGLKFSHPLHHLGKSESDLPVLAIDSFRHMYIFPDVKQLT